MFIFNKQHISVKKFISVSSHKISLYFSVVILCSCQRSQRRDSAFLNPSVSSHTGVWQVWLRFCEWQRNEGQGEDVGEFHLWIPQRSAGAQRVDSSSPPSDWSVRHGAEPDQRVEGTHHSHWSEVNCDNHLLGRELCDHLICFIKQHTHIFTHTHTYIHSQQQHWQSNSDTSLNFCKQYFKQI